MNKPTTVAVNLDPESFAVFQEAVSVSERAGAKVTVSQLLQHHLHNEIRKQNPRRIAQRFLKSVVQQIKVTPWTKGLRITRQLARLRESKRRAPQLRYMAITSPKKNEELLKQFKINPEINVRLEAFMKSEPGLVDFVKQLPREQLERKFLLRKMQDQQQKEGYTTKVKAWLEKPEQKELLKSIQAMISPVMRPERQEQAVVTQAKNFIRNTGIKLS